MISYLVSAVQTYTALEISWIVSREKKQLDAKIIFIF